MTFRARIILAAVLVAVFAVLAASFGAYVASRNSLTNEVNDNLQQTTQEVLYELNHGLVNWNPDNGQIIGFPGAQLYAPGYLNGAMMSGEFLPITEQVRKVAAGKTSGPVYLNVTVHGAEYRELVTSVQNLSFGHLPVGAAALQVGAQLTGVNDQLGHLRLALLLVAVAAVALAVLLGWLLARAAIDPLNDLTAKVEELARTIDVTERLDPGGDDELARLRRAFNRLLEALERSRESQHQLVVDASHELRTPLTSLRTNLELVRRLDELSPMDREVLVSDVLTQLEELTTLVGDLAELARGDYAEQQAAPLRLDHLVEEAVELAASHGRRRGVRFETRLEPCWVEGRPDRLARAVGNLLDNALKWSPEGGVVDVTCELGAVTVRDHGPGIAPADLPHIFDRFYRAAAARALPGSGLGLAIVAQVAQEEGGTVGARNAEGGGAEVRLVLPMVLEPAGASSGA
jgi:two-component system sensor histidine kinase MprB